MSIPSVIYEYLLHCAQHDVPLSAVHIASKFKKAKSTAYGYISEFNQSRKSDKKPKIFESRHRLSRSEFKNFMYSLLKNGGFKSTPDLMLQFNKKFKGRHISKRTFNRYFLYFRLSQAKELKRLILKISRSRVNLRGFYTVKRYRRPSDY